MMNHLSHLQEIPRLMAKNDLRYSSKNERFHPERHTLSRKIKLNKGAILYLQGESAQYFYHIQSGSFKTEMAYANGRSQILGFYTTGDYLGLDGVGNAKYHSEAIAIEASELSVLKINLFQNDAPDESDRLTHLHHIINRKMTQDQQHIVCLGSLNAEQKIARFFLHISENLFGKGLNQFEFDLSMNRQDIGSYLGMQIETVSRMLSKFTQEELVLIKQKHAHILEIGKLYKIVGE